jgi:hypothetical protein
MMLAYTFVSKRENKFEPRKLTEHETKQVYAMFAPFVVKVVKAYCNEFKMFKRELFTDEIQDKAAELFANATLGEWEIGNYEHLLPK